MKLSQKRADEDYSSVQTDGPTQINNDVLRKMATAWDQHAEVFDGCRRHVFTVDSSESAAMALSSIVSSGRRQADFGKPRGKEPLPVTVEDPPTDSEAILQSVRLFFDCARIGPAHGEAVINAFECGVGRLTPHILAGDVSILCAPRLPRGDQGFSCYWGLVDLLSLQSVVFGRECPGRRSIDQRS